MFIKTILGKIKKYKITEIPNILVKKIYFKYLWFNYNFSDTSRPVDRNRVNVYYFKRKGIDNVGDLLSLIIVNFVKESISVKDIPLKTTKRLFAIGSVIDTAKSDITIWGSGFHHQTSVPPNVRLDIRAVRGPETRKKMLEFSVDCPEVYGDPALLLPLFYNPILEKKYDFTIIPHYSKEDAVINKYGENVMSTLTSDWRGFVDRILASRLIVSGSLHGIIIAEAYGIPAILYSDIDRDFFKYNDYYYSTNRMQYQIADTIKEALKFKLNYQPIENLKELQNNLLQSFPKDIWENNK